MPFRATRMWSDLVKDFTAGVRLKKKRVRMKYYQDCFSGSEAVSWIHEYLKTNPNYGSNVNRNQAEQLCQKFLQQNVFKGVLPSCPNTKATFEENRLYSFKTISKRNMHESRESKENEHSKHPKIKVASTRKPTPLKRRLSFSGNIPDAKRPLRERKGFQNLAEEENVNKKMFRKQTASKESTDTTNDMNFNNSPANLKKSLNVANTRASSLSRKWKSEHDLSLIKANICEEDPVMELKSLTTNLLDKPSSSNSAKIAQDSSVAEEIPPDDQCNELWKDICLERLAYVLNVDSFNGILDCDSLSWKNVMENVKSDSRQVKEVVPKWLISAMKYLIHWSNSTDSICSGNDYPGLKKDIFKTISEHFESMSEPLLPLNVLDVFAKISGLATKCKLSAIRALQHILLLLKKYQKQKLQLLLRFMIKISKNQLLNLSNELPTRELAIQTFFPCIFGGDNEILGIRITSFLMDNYCEVFKVPDGLQFQVEQRIVYLRRKREIDIESKTQSVLDSGEFAFCERVTSQEFNEHKQFVTQRCLEDLLDSIVNDEDINDKEKKKKLKQTRDRLSSPKSFGKVYERVNKSFGLDVSPSVSDYANAEIITETSPIIPTRKLPCNGENRAKFRKTYPEIFFSRFPGDGLSMMSQQPSIGKFRQVIKPLGLIKNLR